MPHVCLVPFVGFRIRNDALRESGARLPGLRQRAHALAQLPALGLLTLAGLNPPEWTSSYHPAASADDEFVQSIVVSRPDLVAVSALTASIDEAYRFCEIMQESGVKVVLGGLHATACPEEAQQLGIPVAIGEGEAIWRQILSDAKVGRLRSQYRATGGRSPHVWPQPRFDLPGHRIPRYTVQTQRGCPFACEFCAASRLLGPFREKPAVNLRQEMASIAAIDPSPVVELADDNTFAGRRDPNELFDVLSSANARWFTESDWRIGERPDVLERLASAGCVQVLIGIESLVFRYPGMGVKQVELQRMLRAVERIQWHGVAVNACFIVGAEGETRTSLDRLVQFLSSSEFADVQITLETPFPGTELRRRLGTTGRLLPRRDWSNYTLFDVTCQPDSMTVADLETGFRDVLAQVHSESEARRRAILRRQIWSRNPRLRSLRTEEMILHD